MTVKKTEQDLAPPPPKDGPELINADAENPTVKALKEKYPKALQIEKLASGAFAIRFRRKATKYHRG